MVDRQLAFSVLQLVALSLPAFAILLQMVIESDMAYTHRAVPITTAGLGMFILAGTIFVVELMLAAQSFVVRLSLGLLLLGLLSLLIGGALLGWQTQNKQIRIRDN